MLLRPMVLTIMLVRFWKAPLLKLRRLTRVRTRLRPYCMTQKCCFVVLPKTYMLSPMWLEFRCSLSRPDAAL